MTEFTLPCAEGGAHDCWGRQAPEAVSASYDRLSADQRVEFHDLAEDHEGRGRFEATIDGIFVWADPKVCDACGCDGEHF